MTDRLDDAIDRAAREMLDVEPRADLRARVLSQLPASSFRRPAVGWAVASLAAAALIVLSVFVAQRRALVTPQAPLVAHGDDTRLPVETRGAAASKPSPSDATASPAPASVPVALPLQAVPRIARTVVAASFDAADNQSTAIEPLKTIAPITIAPIAQDSIAPAEIAMDSLNPIREVQIAPLTPPDRRN